MWVGAAVGVVSFFAICLKRSKMSAIKISCSGDAQKAARGECGLRRIACSFFCAFFVTLLLYHGFSGMQGIFCRRKGGKM
jgi:hypothetical protein